MTTATAANVHHRLTELFDYIRAGRILEAIDEFYAEDVVMQENSAPPTIGRQANLERERQFLSTVKEWRGFEVTAHGAGNDATFYETVMDWIAKDGTPVHIEQAVVTKWRDGRILHERFYHNP